MFFILGNSPALIGRGAVRGRQMIETPYYRVERPESSKTDTGKQGIVYKNFDQGFAWFGIEFVCFK